MDIDLKLSTSFGFAERRSSSLEMVFHMAETVVHIIKPLKRDKLLIFTQSKIRPVMFVVVT